MRSIIIKYFEIMNRHFEIVVAVMALLGTIYLGIHIIIWIGRF